MVKALQNVIADAKNNFNLDTNSLKFDLLKVDEGLKIKRMDKSHGSRFARGLIQKRHSRLVIHVKGNSKVIMGQKINPIGFRLETVKNSPEWQSSWYANAKKYSIYLLEDKKIRDFLQKKFNSAGIVSIRIERSVKKIKLILVVSRPGLVIGRGGKELETIKKEVQRLLFKASGKQSIEIQVEEFKHADLSAKLVAEKIAFQLTKRMPYRRIVLSAMEKSISCWCQRY